MKKLFDSTITWQHYLTRPFSLLGASLWHDWYEREECKIVFGENLKTCLFIEEHKNVVRKYHPNNDLKKFNEKLIPITNNSPEKILSALKKGVELNKEAEALLKNPKSLTNLKDATNFLANTAIHGTLLAYRIHSLLTENQELTLNQNTKEEILKISEQLRKVSYYPKLIPNIIFPLVEQKLKEVNIPQPEKATQLITYKELQEKSKEELKQIIKERQSKKEQNNKFLYQIKEGKETVTWTKDTRQIIISIENPQKTSESNTKKEIRGTPAFKGKVTGTARIILSPRDKKEFNKGDILITINANPSLDHYLYKAAAIVTDEGGMACHAAVLSRELKKPCIVGTKNATLIIKDGDKIEVDADRGVVKIVRKEKR